jgi:hypothetical protein
VRVLLDAFFDNQDLDSSRSNLRTVEYLNVGGAGGRDRPAGAAPQPHRPGDPQ